MSSKPPPVPPRNRAAKAPPSTRSTPTSEPAPARKRNLKEQGRQGNIRQNTTNQGYQQDR